MSKSSIALAFLAAVAVPLAVRAESVPPTIVPVPPKTPEASIAERGLSAAALWDKADPAAVSLAYENLHFSMPAQGKWNSDDRLFMVDWITALFWTDPARAAAKLAEWRIADPQPLDSAWAARQLVLETQILSNIGKVSQNMSAIAATLAALDAATERVAVRARTNPKKRMSDADFDEHARIDAVRKIARRAEFVLAAHEKGDAAFADFADLAVNPFVDGSGTLFLTTGGSVSCAQHDLTEADWAIFEVSLVRGKVATSNAAYVRPFAASRFAAFKPFLEQSKDWRITVKNGTGDQARKAVLLRCLRTTRPVAEKQPDLDYLATYLTPLNKELPPEYRFDKFRQPVADLARDGAWFWVMNLAMNIDNTAPQLQGDARTLLIKMLREAAKPDPVAIAVAEHIALPDAEVGMVWQLRNRLPPRIAFVDRIRAEGKVPPRILSEFELQLAQRYESNGEPALATVLYKAIAARDHAANAPRVPEQIKALLRLAAMAGAAGRKSESEAVFVDLGLSPDQCSIYQSRPAMLSFRHPDYSGGMLRAESEGRVLFEFDLDQTGAPSNLRVTQAAPPFLFDRKTLQSFAAAKFAPVTNGTEALACKGAEQAFMWRIPE